MNNKNFKYNDCPMMTMKEYDEAEGYDLNFSDYDILDLLSLDDTIVWLTKINLVHDGGIMPSGEHYEQTKVIYNAIYPYKVIHSGKSFFLRPISVLNEKYPLYKFDDEYQMIKFHEGMGVFSLDENVHASTSYEYINRYREEEYKKLKAKESFRWINQEKKEMHEFSIEEAKKALSKVYSIPVDEITIKTK